MNVEVNYLAVLLAAIANMVVGFLWYSKILFAKPWMEASGMTEEKIEAQSGQMTRTYIISFVGALVMAYVLFHVMALSENFFHYERFQTGLTSAFWMWLGFIAPVQLTEVLFGGKSLRLYGINTGYQLAAMLAMGAVLGLM